MKTKALFLVFLIALGSSFAAHAQLTTGTPTSKVVLTGNRAKAGDYGIYLGATSTMFGNMFNDNVELTPLPLINFKYMKTNDLELRLGVETYKLKETLNGNIAESENTTIKSNQKYGESLFMAYPGFAHHFSNLNVLDVYVGAELPLGWNTNTAVNSGEDYTAKTSKRSFVLGLGAFIGLQAYVADLPVAVGFEYGISSRLDTGLKYRNEYTSENKSTVTYSPTYDFNHINPTSDEYEKLQARKGEIGSQFRFTVSYYFK